MADISTYLSQIRNAKRGETVRDSITGALKTMSRDGVNAERLSGRPVSYFATAKDVNNIFLTSEYQGKPVMENSVVKGSKRAVTSGAIYDLLIDLNDQFNELLGT